MIQVDQENAEKKPLEAGNVHHVKIIFEDLYSGTTPPVSPGRTYTVKIVTNLGNEFPVDLKLLP